MMMMMMMMMMMIVMITKRQHTLFIDISQTVSNNYGLQITNRFNAPHCIYKRSTLRFLTRIVVHAHTHTSFPCPLSQVLRPEEEVPRCRIMSYKDI